MTSDAANPPLWLSMLPIALLMCLLGINVACFGDGATSGPNQTALLLTAAFAAALGHFVLRINYHDMERGALHSIGLAMQANLILLVVGALIGLWIMAGVVPTLIYYGVKLIHPAVFLLVACVACSIVSISIGSSWSTMGTVGVALIGMASALEVPLAMTAGAIVSGAYFGDKLSPLSDTTNLAPATAGSELFIHVRHMLYTTIPAYFLTLTGFTLLGFTYDRAGYDPSLVASVLADMESHFSIGVHTLIAPVVVLILVMRRMPALPALVIGALLGAGEALIFQRPLFAQSGDPFSWKSAYMALIDTAHAGFTSNTGNATLDGLFSRGGMSNMLNTVFLIISAMVFGGIMESTGMLRSLAHTLLRFVRGTGSLVGATVGTCILFNLTASDQYLSIVVPGRMFRHAYAERNLDPRNLSRALEDGGTVTSVLVPWNTCGAFAASVLNVPTATYAPYCLFNLLCPVVSVFMASMNLGIKKAIED